MPATSERQKRAQGREQRRSGAASKPAEQEENDRSSGGDDDGKGHGTAALVLAGAGAGALAGTLRSLRKRRSRRDGVKPGRGEEPARDESPADGDSEQPSSTSGTLRGMTITVLEAALDGLKSAAAGGEAEPDDPDRPAEGDDEEDEGEEEEDDDEEDVEPRGGESGSDRPAPRGSDEEDGDVAEAASATEADSGSADGSEEDEESAPAGRNGAGGGGDHESPSVELVRRARDQLAQLVGREPESVSYVEHRDDGWQLGLEVVELERIPHSTDVLASYEVTLDEEGHLLEYARAERYVRSRSDEARG